MELLTKAASMVESADKVKSANKVKSADTVKRFRISSGSMCKEASPAKKAKSKPECLDERIDNIAEEANRIARLNEHEFHEVIKKLMNIGDTKEPFVWEFIQILIKAHQEHNKERKLNIIFKVLPDGHIVAHI